MMRTILILNIDGFADGEADVSQATLSYYRVKDLPFIPPDNMTMRFEIDEDTEPLFGCVEEVPGWYDSYTVDDTVYRDVVVVELMCPDTVLLKDMYRAHVDACRSGWHPYGYTHSLYETTDAPHVILGFPAPLPDCFYKKEAISQ